MRVVIVDDHPLVRNGLKQTIELESDMEVVGCAASCREGEALILSHNPDLAVVDLKMPDGNGLEVVQNCKKQASACRFLILTAYASPQDISKALSEHVGGYILKEALPEEIIDAVRRVGGGRRYFDPDVMEKAINGNADNPINRLTAREIDILNAVASGLNNRAIAEKLPSLGDRGRKTFKKTLTKGFLAVLKCPVIRC